MSDCPGFIRQITRTQNVQQVQNIYLYNLPDVLFCIY